MAVHGESLKRFLPFYKSNCLVASSSPYNWLQTEKFLALGFAVLRSLYELNKSDEVATLRWKLSSWNNRRQVGESGLNGICNCVVSHPSAEKCMFVVVFVCKFTAATLEYNWKNFDVLVGFTLLNWIDQYTICENQSNGWKVLRRVIFLENFLFAPLAVWLSG
jgi:hypothetical protein